MSRVEQMIVMHARQRVEGIDAVTYQAFDHRIRGAHMWHRLCLPKLQHATAIGRQAQRMSAPAQEQTGQLALRAMPSVLDAVEQRQRHCHAQPPSRNRLMCAVHCMQALFFRPAPMRQQD